MRRGVKSDLAFEIHMWRLPALRACMVWCLDTGTTLTLHLPLLHNTNLYYVRRQIKKVLLRGTSLCTVPVINKVQFQYAECY